MTEKQPDRREGSNMERHVQTLIVFIITAILAYVGLTVNSNSIMMAQMSTNMGWMKESLEQMQEQLDESTTNRYTRMDAANDKSAFLFRIESCEKRLDTLEGNGH